MVNGGFLDVHLLHDAGKVSIAMHGAAAAGTDFESVLLEVSDLFGREGLAFVLGVAGLAADGTLGPVLKGGLGLDDVRGRGLGGRGGILAGSGQVFAPARESSRRDGVDLFGLQRIRRRRLAAVGSSDRVFLQLFP